MPALDPFSILAILLALALGGLLKGATGAGTPVVAVPVMAAFFDVRLAVVIMVTPNLVTNLWQWHSFRHHTLPGGFGLALSLAGALGALLGTALLATAPVRLLSLLVAAAVLAYISLRVLKPHFRLAFEHARRIVWPVGVAGGVLQGAVGISAPISVTFLNAMRLERPQFICTISLFFIAMSVVQIPTLFLAGLMTPQLLALGVLAMLPQIGAMPLGEWLARRISAQTFDRLILGLLAALALRLVWTALA